jgi:hypothetical protein
MTTIERFTYAGTRRFDAVPRTARAARHRRRHPAAVRLAAAADIVRRAGRRVVDMPVIRAASPGMRVALAAVFAADVALGVAVLRTFAP